VSGRGSWSLALFATRVDDDLIFVSSGRARGSGHFENVERTNRRGLEAAGEWRAGRLTLSGTYSWQQATYGTDLDVLSPTHPDADDGELQVRAGDRLPGVPAHVARVALSARLSTAVDLGASWRAQSPQFLRGDEANLLAPVPAFSVVDAYARWRLGQRLSVIAHGSNLFDSAYATFGMLGDASLLGESYEDEPRFVSPGGPRAGWIGVELRF
jgi:outer membrane receptor protein involved in Fe transport